MIIEKRGTDKIYQSILFDNVNEFVEVIKSWCIGVSETRKESQLYTWRDLRENIIGLINDKHIRFNHNDEGYMISADNVKYTLGKIDLFENGFVYDFAVIEPISYIGAMEIMANKDTYSSTLQATADSIIIEISKEDFINWIENDHKLALDVLHFVSDNMYKQALKTGEVLAYPAICTLINYLINVFESENKDEVFIEKTREEIASILGVSVRTINRNLKILKEENLLSVSRKGILITKKQCEKLYEKLDLIK